MHVRRRAMQLDLGAQDVTERAVRVRQRVEEIRIRVVRARRDALSPRYEHVGLDQAGGNEAVAEARRFDAEADGRAADGDVLELGRYERQKSFREARADHGLVRRETFDLGRLRLRVDLEHVVEVAQRDAPRGGAARLVAEQIRYRRLREPDVTCAALPVAPEPRRLLAVAAMGVRRRHAYASTAHSSPRMARTALGRAEACQS